ncbi:MAG: hypothetical protein HYU64_05555, partial [Armatimonadetes bacterium]|nr:hypothetical protein [Armatimonadota bacterium]
HDLAFTADPIRSLPVGFDKEHPANGMAIWAEEAPELGGIFHPRDLAGMGRAIKTHQDPDLNFQNDFIGSVVRLTDNLGLSFDTKLPPLLSDHPSLLSLMQRLHLAVTSKEPYSGVLDKLVDQIENLPGADPVEKTALLRSMRDVGPKSPPIYFGMLGVGVKGFEVDKSGKITVVMENTPLSTTLGENFGMAIAKKGFAKFIKLYKWQREGNTYHLTDPRSGGQLDLRVERTDQPLTGTLDTIKCQCDRNMETHTRIEGARVIAEELQRLLDGKKNSYLGVDDLLYRVSPMTQLFFSELLSRDGKGEELTPKRQAEILTKLTEWRNEKSAEFYFKN